MTNREPIHFFYDCFNNQDLSTIESIIDPNILLHDTLPGETSGVDAFKGNR